jgi:hypothetical protein
VFKVKLALLEQLAAVLLVQLAQVAPREQLV